MQSPATSQAKPRLWRALPVALTITLAVSYFVVARTEIFTIVSEDGNWVIPITLLAQAMFLGFRYRWPLITFWGVIALDIPIMFVSHGELTAASFAIMVATYNLRRHSAAKRAYAMIALGFAVTTAIHFLTVQQSTQIVEEWRLFAALGQALATYAIASVIAEAVLAQGRLSSILRERAELAERDQERNAKEAVQQERNLIARELHDIAAHHLTGIILSSQAVKSLLVSNPEQASEYLATVQSEARTALENIRQTVGLLRTDGEGDLAPAPSLDDLPQLVSEHRARGTTVELSSIGNPAALGTIAGIAVYRTVQESLANAAKHAPGAACTVEATWTDTHLSIVIANSASTREVLYVPSGGHGLLGMRERASLVNGTLTVGPRVDGGWSTQLTVPIADHHSSPTESSQ
ncbi:sensor histidine kinase [Lysinibacter cavernae]|uniref:histidine kinase n=1 Tax=Lysinibacter cavernae TaxID=1640652 RepID=A0A7X5R3F5_9MICO|nr:sensor histidine kinase [Lysinibacter cavernae]NIH54866.1 signal transduction histidine kinase [Lysinibacter cavernae]